MNLTKCANGHYYDADKYSSCPHCSKANDTEDDVTINMEQAGATVPHTPAPVPTPAPAPAPRTQQSGTVSLMDAVNVASAPVSAPAFDDNDKTVSYYGGSIGIEPVVGWLVCIDGEMKGKAFELKNGKNFIGRSHSMDVVLEGDPNVSRERHAIVTYEPRGRVFIAQPGESRELFYLNDQVVLMNVEMHDRDILSIGKTQLMFVPLCGPAFTWESDK